MGIYEKFCFETFGEDGALKSLTLEYPKNFNFGYDIVDKIAEEEPEKRALVWCNTEKEEHVFSFEDIKVNSNKMANVFLEAGIKKGDKVLLVLKRHYEYWFAAVALHKIGALMIPATHMLTVEDYIYRINVADVKAILCTAQNDVPMHIGEAMKRMGKKTEELKVWCVTENTEGFEKIWPAMEKASSSLERVETDCNDPMLMYFTSGTTGLPKGVIHDYTYPLAHIVTARHWQKAQENGLHFTVAETGWGKASWGKIYGQWLVGSAVMVYDFENFDPKQLVNIINKYEVTSFCAPPTIYRYLVRKDIPPMPSLKESTTAGETLAPEVFKLFKEKTGLTLREGYGQTETTLLMANFQEEKAKDGSMGVISPLYNIELRNRAGLETVAGEIGEIVIIPENDKRQPGIFCGYLGNDEQYEYVWRDGVYHTGDAAYTDENGQFWFHGRFDDIIKTGGFRVGPYEVENVIMKHPAVVECSVIGIPDKLRGQAIKAVIVLGQGIEKSKALEQEIKEFCNQKLAEYKWIKHIEFLDKMPKTISGKIRKIDLRMREES